MQLTKLYTPVEVFGQGGISAKIILDSVSALSGDRLTTFELIYHRNIHSELMTHRFFTRNAASSRAIPFNKMKEQCNAMPIYYGKNQSGMQAYEEIDEISKIKSEVLIEQHRINTLNLVETLFNLGNHKQTFNRLSEPFQFIKTVVSATEFDNFFWLRNHEAADPLIHELAKVMQQCYKESSPVTLKSGEWHLPYVDMLSDRNHYIELDNNDYIKLSLDDAIKVSAARCAAVSFRNTDYGVEKSKEVYQRLVGDDRKHASALEHPAKVMSRCQDPFNIDGWDNGVSHVDKHGNLWSGNFQGFVQLRKTIPDECYVK
jgi:thymidylate synthase ThyX